MKREKDALADTLAAALEVIANSNEHDRRHIALAYQAAKQLATGVPQRPGAAKMRVALCLKQSDVFRKIGDLASVGWMLVAIKEQLKTREGLGWQPVHRLADEVEDLLLADDTRMN